MRTLSLLSLVLFLPSIGMANRESDYSKIAVLRMQTERYLTSLPNNQPTFANYGDFDVEKNLSKTLSYSSGKYTSLLQKVSSRQELENSLLGLYEKSPGSWAQLSGRWNVVYTCSYPANIHFGASTYHCNPVFPSPYFHFQINSASKWVQQGGDAEYQTKEINALNDHGEIKNMGIQVRNFTSGAEPVDLNFDLVTLSGDKIQSVVTNCDMTKDHLIVCFSKQKISETSVYYQPDLNSEDHPDLEDNSAGWYYIVQVLGDLQHETNLRNQE